MENKYPHHCCRCGFCCLSIPCPIAMQIYGMHEGQCMGLSFDEQDRAVCGVVVSWSNDGIDRDLIFKTMGIGRPGCCIKARCFRDGVEYDFASLPDDIKKKVVKGIRK